MSAEAVFDALGPVLTRWTMGGTAIGDAPLAWKDAIAGDDAELRLLALSGQFLGAFVLPDAPADLHVLPDLPALAMPPVPDALRPLARRCMKAMQLADLQRGFIHLLAARGHMMHPADWMPGRNDESLPDVYAPLQDWVGGASGRGGTGEVLTEANWSDFSPAARCAAFATLRRTDPDAARVILAAKAADENADVRLRLIAGMAAGLSIADVPYLQSLVSDRAPKVKACATSLLARLGFGSADNSEATELAAFFAFETKGLLRRTRVLTATAIKTPAQRSRRHELFGRVDFTSLSSALGADDLVALWPFGSDILADADFVAMVAQSANDDVVAASFARLMEASTVNVHSLLPLCDRLDIDARKQAARQLLRTEGALFRIALMIVPAGSEMDGVIDTRAGLALLAAINANADIVGEVQPLGLIASCSAAQMALDKLVRAGLNAADPRLDLLRLNAALTPKGAAE